MLYAAAFLDETEGWAVGELGLILHTIDGSATWASQASGTSSTLYGIALSGGQAWAVGDGGVILHSRGGGAWATQASGTSQTLRGVAFADASNGWAVGYSATTDGGATWAAQASGTSQSLRAAAFVNQSEGWAAGGWTTTLLHTTNGGQNWTPQSTKVSQGYILGLAFTDSQKGWAVGDEGTIQRTTNGGASWAIQRQGFVFSLSGLSFATASQGWAVGQMGNIFRTSDGGQTWTSQTSNTDRWLNGVAAVPGDASRAWAVGDSGTIRKTANGGSTWITQTLGTQPNLLGVTFVNSTKGWIVGDGGNIFRTSDGDNWLPQNSGTSVPSLRAVTFLSDTLGWIVGDGIALRTTNGGANWTRTLTTSTNLRAVYFVDALNGWAAGDNGAIIHTADGGQNWSAQASGATATLYGIAFTDANNGWAVGASGTLLYTTNGGQTWLSQSFLGNDFSAIAVRSGLVWAAGYRGLVTRAASVDLSASAKSVSSSTASPGQVLTYTVTVTNTGSGNAPEAAVTDTIPLSTTFQAGSLSSSWGKARYSDGLVSWTGPITTSASARLTYSVALTGPWAGGGTVTNTAWLYDGATPPWQTAPVTTTVSSPDLSTSRKMVSSASASPGQVATYTLFLTNTGSGAASGARLTDTLPSLVAYRDGSLASSSGAAGYTNGVVTWTSSLAAGASAAITYSALLGSPLDNGTAITNTATLDDGANPPFETAPATTTVSSSPDLSTSRKTVSGATASPGQVLTYTVTLINTGNMNASARLTDTLPISVTYVPGSVTAGATYVTDTGAITWTGAVTAGSAVSVTYSVSTPSTLDNGAIITNTATIHDGMNPLFETVPVTTSLWSEAFAFRAAIPLLLKSWAVGW